MYSKKIINNNLSKFASVAGWEPQPHTFQEVKEFTAYIQSIISIENSSKSTFIELIGDVSRSKAKEIHRWIENEQVMCAIDCSYWEDNYAYITDSSGDVVKFKNMRSQQIFDNIIAEADEKNNPVELLVMTSRQVGITTKSILKLAHRTLFHSNTESVCFSPLRSASYLTNKILDDVYTMCPWWLVPQRISKGNFTNKSRISFMSGFQGSRGITPQCVYVSNIADFARPVDTIEREILRSIHTNRKTLTILHGDIGDKSSWSKSLWDFSKNNWENGTARFRPIYIPWTTCSDLYGSKQFLESRPIPDKWKPSKETKDHKIKCESYIQRTPYLRDAVGEGWTMPIEQQWFYEFGYNQAASAQYLEGWKARMAADDDECIEFSEEANRKVDLDDIFPISIKTQNRLKEIY